MCGRFTLALDPGELREELDLGPVVADLQPHYNIAPTQPVAVVIDGRQRQVEAYRWGLVPGWAKDLEMGSRMINARSETLSGKTCLQARFCPPPVFDPGGWLLRMGQTGRAICP